MNGYDLPFDLIFDIFTRLERIFLSSFIYLSVYEIDLSDFSFLFLRVGCLAGLSYFMVSLSIYDSMYHLLGSVIFSHVVRHDGMNDLCSFLF